RDRDERPVVTQVEQRQVTGRVVRGRSREREFVAAVAAPLTGLEAQVAALWTFHGGSSHGRKQRVLDFTQESIHFAAPWMVTRHVHQGVSRFAQASADRQSVV